MKSSISLKRKARKLALQSLYQWQMSGGNLADIKRQFHAANDMYKVDVSYYHQLLEGVYRHLNDIEAILLPLLDRPIDSINPVELTALRISSFELMFCKELPYRVVLDEAVSLTKEFGSQEGYRYVNGVLNHLAKQVRVDEINTPDE